MEGPSHPGTTKAPTKERVKDLDCDDVPVTTRISDVRARCTAVEPIREEFVTGKIPGPDEGWCLLKNLDTFCSGEGAILKHLGGQHYTHVCAYHGAWAFDPGGGSPARCVTFLHYSRPKKLEKLMGNVDAGSGKKEFQFSGTQLLETYRRLQAKGLQVHVWRRREQGEIAIDFCLGHGMELPKEEKAPKEEKTFTKKGEKGPKSMILGLFSKRK